jgi:lipopolysaccharide export system permease protein
MKIFWYIARHVLLTIALVLLVVVAIDFAFAVIAEIKSIGTNTQNYSWRDAIIYVLLRLPSDIYLIFPIAAFLGSLISLMIFSLRSELIVMRAAGVSIFQLAQALLLSTGILLIIYYSLSLFIAPYTRYKATIEDNIFQNNQDILILAKQTWLRSGDHFLLLGTVLPDGNIQNVTDFQLHNGVLQTIRQIEGIHLNTDNTWTLQHIEVTSLTDKGASKTYNDILTEPSLIAPKLLAVITMQPDEMDIVTLHHYIQYRKQNNLDIKSYVLQFWNRIFEPLMLPIMILIAIPFVLGSHRSRIHLKIFIGLALGFSFYIVGQFFGSLTLLTALPAFWGALLPALIFGSILAVLLWILS